VAAISAGLATKDTQQINSIGTLFSTYANSTTVAAISAGLNTRAIAGNYFVALADASSIAINAALGNVFTVSLTATGHTIATPSNPTPRQKITIAVRQAGTGSYDWTWDTGYRFGTDVTDPTPSTAVGKNDYYGFCYNEIDSKWDCLAYARGY